MRRFRDLDRYRVAREWSRYEGTAQRDLFRQLRERFLRRHAATRGWVLEVGVGPGRFSAFVGIDGVRRVGLDLSRKALEQARAGQPQSPSEERAASEFIRGDGRRLPFRRAAFEEVVGIGNVLGFAGADGSELLSRLGDAVRPGGGLILEIVPGSGETSRYLHRLPNGAVARLLRSPIAAIRPRVEHEGFAPKPARRRGESGFRRWSAREIEKTLTSLGFTPTELVAVGPCLGDDAPKLAKIAEDTRSWERLLELEEEMGRQTLRWANAAALLIAARKSQNGTPVAPEIK